VNIFNSIKIDTMKKHRYTTAMLETSSIGVESPKTAAKAAPAMRLFYAPYLFRGVSRGRKPACTLSKSFNLLVPRLCLKAMAGYLTSNHRKTA
jgi:hypothetical protein